MAMSRASGADVQSLGALAPENPPSCQNSYHIIIRCVYPLLFIH